MQNTLYGIHTILRNVNNNLELKLQGQEKNVDGTLMRSTFIHIFLHTESKLVFKKVPTSQFLVNAKYYHLIIHFNN